MLGKPWRRYKAFLFAATACLALAACDTAEERAEGHYESAVELIEAGDFARARVEFQNVFKLNPRHRDARALFARTLMEQGTIREAFGQYLRLVEQYPEDQEARLALASMAMRMNQWDAAIPHVEKLVELSPNDPPVQMFQNMLAYRNALLEGDDDARRARGRDAVAFKEILPDSIVNRTLIVDSLNLDKEYATALDELEELIPLDPANKRLHQLRIQLNQALGDTDALEAALFAMLDAFPDDPDAAQTIIAYRMSQNDLDGVEDFLRTRYEPGVQNDAARIQVVQFANEVRSFDETIQTVEEFIEEGTNTPLFRSYRATILFDNGQQDIAVAELEDIIANGEPSETLDGIKVTFAEILNRMGNDVGSRALIEEVLESDPGNVDALRIKATALVREDETEEAITLLRRALDQDPQNVRVLLTAAQAHMRNGERDLAGEMLAMASQAAGGQFDVDYRYAQFLIGSQRYAAAESVLRRSLRTNRQSLPLYQLLAQVFLATEDWARHEEVERQIRTLNVPNAEMQATSMQVSRLRAQGRTEDAVAVLESIPSDDPSALSADIAIINEYFNNNDPEAAKAHVAELKREQPDSPTVRFLEAAVAASSDNLPEAETIYRELLDSDIAGPLVYIELSRVLAAQGRVQEASGLVDQGVERFPNAGQLLWLQATYAERETDYEKAIGIYERLYEQDRNNIVVANNLASLLSTARDDEESLERAWRVARRLRGTDFAAYQDTYGWIAYRRGNYEEALQHLEPAAAGLRNDPLVNYHLGMTYVQLQDWQKAIESLERALELAGDDPRPQFETARTSLAEAKTTLATLENRGNTAPTDGQ